MVLNSSVVVRVATVSANACQCIACNPERLGSEDVLRLLFCFPLQNLRRLALRIWTLFCFPPNPYLSSSFSSWSSSDSDHDVDDLHSD